MPSFAVLTLAVALSAAPTDWRAAAEAFKRGAESGTSPVTTGERATCAGHWLAWDDAIKEQRLTRADLDLLPDAVGPQAARRTANAWAEHAEADPRVQEDLAAAQSRAAASLSAAIAGDSGEAAKLLERLGLCPAPEA